MYGDGQAYYYFVYPNVMLNVMPGRLQTNRVLPLGPGRCRVEFEWFYTPTDEAMARVDNDREFTNNIQEEDVDICERVQRGSRVRPLPGGPAVPEARGGRVAFPRAVARRVRPGLIARSNRASVSTWSVNGIRLNARSSRSRSAPLAVRRSVSAASDASPQLT